MCTGGELPRRGRSAQVYSVCTVNSWGQGRVSGRGTVSVSARVRASVRVRVRIRDKTRARR